MKRISRMMCVVLLGSLVGMAACLNDAVPDPKSVELSPDTLDEADIGPVGDDAHVQDAQTPSDTYDTQGNEEDIREMDADAQGDLDASGARDAGGGADTEDDPDIEDDTESCTPTITACSDGLCGVVDDGCGNTLDCGVCSCEGGVVQAARCGTCGLGMRVCGSGETGPGSCEAPELPGIAEDASPATCESLLIFVDASAAAGGDGTQVAPFKSYAAAAASASAGQVIILGGPSDFAERLTVKNGVSVLGGFGGAPEFSYDESGRSDFEVPGGGSGDIFGLKAEGISQATTVARVEVATGDAPAGATNYGAYLRDASSLTLRSVKVRAGKGGKGADGAHGSDGADGGDGEDGHGGSNHGIDFPVYGGTHGENTECTSANGGRGGKSYHWPQSGESPAGSGRSTAGAYGGAGGVTSSVHSQAAGKNGHNAQPPISSGQNGIAGISGGEIESDLWVASGAGSDGLTGNHGFGGGGGGGTYLAKNPERMATSGAGGGAGGCAGKGGGQGKPGAGSFGLFVIDSNALLMDSSFRAGHGGVGGKGGKGGFGGNGGNGGIGTNQSYRHNPDGTQHMIPATLPFFSGSGGRGADGSNGGAGGGGAGGVSYGAYCSDSQPTITATTFISGGSAPGGQSPGNPGGSGLSEDSFGCD